MDPKTGIQLGYVFSCFNQDQDLDSVDFDNLAGRLKQTSMQEELASMSLALIWKREPDAQGGPALTGLRVLAKSA